MITKLLLEGGASGHLAQIQELGDITFSEILEIFHSVFSGEVEIKEKIDGIALTVTMKDGNVYFSRNKSTLKNPMSVQDAIEFFSDRNPKIRDTFNKAIHDLESALVKLNKREQNSIFADGHNFINLEIVNVGATNIIDYGLERGLLIFHGLQQFDDNWHQLNTDASKASELFNYLKSKDLLHQDSHDISGPAVLKINNSMKASKALLKITRKLNALIKGISPDTTLADYVASKTIPTLKENAGDLAEYVNVDVAKKLMSRTKHPMSMKLTSMSDMIATFKEQNDTLDNGKIRAFIKSCETEGWFDDAIANALDPVVDIVIEAGQLIINCLSGFIAVHPDETAKKLQDELEQITANDNSGKLTANEFKRYEAALKKLDHFNKQINATEGIVFTYKGKIYKLTSTFGPLNQLIGLFKFRDVAESKQLFESDSPHILDSVVQANPNSEFVVYIRGSLKPPHRGHIEMIRKYSEMNCGKKLSIKIMISNPQKSVRPLPNGQIITGEQSVDAVCYLIKAGDIKNIDIVETSDDSPYNMMFNNITDDDFKASKNKIIVFGISDKEDKETIDGLNGLIKSILDELDDSDLPVEEWPRFVDPNTTSVRATISDDDKALSATEFRNELAKITSDTPIMDRVKMVKQFLPNSLSNEEILNYLDIINIPKE